ncbi:MAG: class III signal peptide-containing protein [archaeon]|nr:class III signal peptide-containing protein [archaeon]
MEEKAQGAIEYLLLIAGAILVAAVVLSLLASMTPDVTDAANNKLHNFLGEI